MTEIVLTSLVSIVLTGGAAFITLGRKVVPREEIVELIRVQSLGRGDAGAVCETHCPYIADKRAIGEQLERIAEAQDELRELVRATREELSAVKAIVSRRHA